tara:strand:- start:250 stop:1356 length:1107 start_codon:yes stop_codon:yes gene_type:complete
MSTPVNKKTIIQFEISQPSGESALVNFELKNNMTEKDLYIDNENFVELKSLESLTIDDLNKGLRAKLINSDFNYGGRYGSVVSITEKNHWVLLLLSRRITYSNLKPTSMSKVLNTLLDVSMFPRFILKNSPTENMNENYNQVRTQSINKIKPEEKLEGLEKNVKKIEEKNKSHDLISKNLNSLYKVYCVDTGINLNLSPEENIEISDQFYEYLFVPDMTYHPIEIFRLMYLSIIEPDLLDPTDIFLISNFLFDQIEINLEEFYHYSKYENLRNIFLNQEIDFNKIYQNSKNIIENYSPENLSNILPISPHENDALLANGLKKINSERFTKLFLQNHFFISQLKDRDMFFTQERFMFLKNLANKEGKVT